MCELFFFWQFAHRSSLIFFHSENQRSLIALSVRSIYKSDVPSSVKNTISVETKGYKAGTGTTLVSGRTEILSMVSSRHCCHRNWRFEVSKSTTHTSRWINIKNPNPLALLFSIFESRLPNQTIIYVHLPNNADTLSLNCIHFASHPFPFSLWLPHPSEQGTKHNLSNISLSNEKLIDFRKPFKIL